VVARFIDPPFSFLHRDVAVLPHGITLEMSFLREEYKVRPGPLRIFGVLSARTGLLADLPDGEEHTGAGFQEIQDLFLFKVHPSRLREE
jgi:hypothetical protein